MNEETTQKNKGGRPYTYKKEYCEMVDIYLQDCIDEYENNKLSVNIPTIEGFALFIGVALSTLYDWKRDNNEFSESLEKILHTQKNRLINKGLANEYNSTIAKLMLSANHNMKEKSDVTTNDEPIVTKEIKWIIEDGTETT